MITPPSSLVFVYDPNAPARREGFAGLDDRQVLARAERVRRRGHRLEADELRFRRRVELGEPEPFLEADLEPAAGRLEDERAAGFKRREPVVEAAVAEEAVEAGDRRARARRDHRVVQP